MKQLFVTILLAVAANCFADNAPHLTKSDEADGIIGGHEYVDLGLPSGTLWATYNIGATSPYEKGLYFAWGEVEPKEDFTWENYKFFKGIEYDPNNGSWAILEDIGEDISGTEYDAARHQWGNGWRLPNEQERYELRMLCWCNGLSEENGIRGARIHGPNGHSIFLPITGYGLWYGVEDYFQNTDGSYWTGSDYKQWGYNGRPIEPSIRATSMLVDLGGFNKGCAIKAYGLNVRAVINPTETEISNIISHNQKATITYNNGCISITGKHSDGTVKIYNISGRLVFTDSVNNGICKVGNLPKGAYIVSYATRGNTPINQKIMIK